jgi:hypothetical protein
MHPYSRLFGVNQSRERVFRGTFFIAAYKMYSDAGEQRCFDMGWAQYTAALFGNCIT